MPSENDPKGDAIDYRHKPETEKILRQFLSLESGNFVSAQMRKNYEVATKGSDVLVAHAPCNRCAYIAATVAEISWHEERNIGHECCPENKPLGPVAVQRCSKCFRPLTDSCGC